MGNLLGLPYIDYYDKKQISKILELEGWIIVYKNNEYIYYNKYNKIEMCDYPKSISDCNDIYDFYKTELLTPSETIFLLNELLNNNSIVLLEEDIHKIQHMIKKIENENDNIELKNILGLCLY